ncbi:hypothetical protein ORY94_12925 [Enterococcus casseliflavus]|uniref:hypothetical protein n=1 Tax=Enterococcus casseliflavus TaxID=37734 RepID=UPI00224CECCB|nr:hypothetical protein [Enterococcus casseliflavus]MCX4168827.1 hypothetical protein [Enterococcus casseliflavus]MDV7700993.1 hypothetical protein [Enterococcus casseliflavus]
MATFFAGLFFIGLIGFIFGIILFYIGLITQKNKRDRNVFLIVASAFIVLFSYGGLSFYQDVTSFDSITAQLSLSLRNEARKNESFGDATASMEQPQENKQLATTKQAARNKKNPQTTSNMHLNFLVKKEMH